MNELLESAVAAHGGLDKSTLGTLGAVVLSNEAILPEAKCSHDLVPQSAE